MIPIQQKARRANSILPASTGTKTMFTNNKISEHVDRINSLAQIDLNNHPAAL